MKTELVIILIASILGGMVSASCQENEEPNCTAQEGEGCSSQYSTCQYSATHTEVDTEQDTDSTSQQSEKLALCEDEYCRCIEFVGCEMPIVCAEGTD